MSSIKNLMPDDCLVLRDGVKRDMVTTELVPGDVLYIRLGDKLPADVRYIETSPDAKFDRSILTGEVDPLRGVVDNAERNYVNILDLVQYNNTNMHARWRHLVLAWQAPTASPVVPLAWWYLLPIDPYSARYLERKSLTMKSMLTSA